MGILNFLNQQTELRDWGVLQECKDYVCRPALRILAEAAKNGGFQRFRPHELSRLIWAVASQSCWGSPGMLQQEVGSAQTPTAKQDGQS